MTAARAATSAFVAATAAMSASRSMTFTSSASASMCPCSAPSSGAEPELASPRGAGFRLRRKLSLAIGPFGAACTALVEHPQLAELWPEYLIRQHQIIRATVPLTEVAAERARALTDADPVASGLAGYLDERP